jgi:hypothetical protein
LLLRDASKLDGEVWATVDVFEIDQGDVAAVTAATDDDDPIEGYARIGASSGGAEHRHGYGEIDGLGRTEELLDATDASVIHLRCGYFFTILLMDLDSLRAGTITTTLPLDPRMPCADPADLSSTEVAGILTDSLGSRITATQVTDAAVASQLEQAGLGPAQVDGIVGMSQRIRENRPPADPRFALTKTRTSLASWVVGTLRPLL